MILLNTRPSWRSWGNASQTKAWATTRTRRRLVCGLHSYKWLCDSYPSFSHHPNHPLTPPPTPPVPCQELLELHTELLTDLDTHEEKLQSLQSQCRALVESNNLGASRADERVRSAAATMAELQEQGDERRVRLAEMLQQHAFEASMEEFEDWLELCEERLRKAAGSSSPEECAVLQKQCNALVQDLAKGEQRHESLAAKAAALVSAGHARATVLADMAETAKARWATLCREAEARRLQLAHEYELLRFHRDADETMDWIAEKERELEKKDLGENYADAEVLQRKHAALERDLEALGAKLEAVFAEAGRLVALHPTQAKPITQKQNSMAARWEAMQDNASNRKRLLQNTREYFQFQASGGEILAWVERSADDILSVEPPSDVADAEARLDQHLELKVQLDAQQPSIDSLLAEGERLQRQQHPRAADIGAVLADIRERHADLLLLWEEHVELRREAVFVQEFHREASEFEAWLVAHEAYVRSGDVGADAGGDSIDLLLQKFGDFEQSMAARAEQVARVDKIAEALTAELEDDQLNPVYRRFTDSRAARSLHDGSGGSDTPQGRRTSVSMDKARRRRATLDAAVGTKGNGRMGQGRARFGSSAGHLTPEKSPGRDAAGGASVRAAATARRSSAAARAPAAASLSPVHVATQPRVQSPLEAKAKVAPGGTVAVEGQAQQDGSAAAEEKGALASSAAVEGQAQQGGAAAAENRAAQDGPAAAEGQAQQDGGAASIPAPEGHDGAGARNNFHDGHRGPAPATSPSPVDSGDSDIDDEQPPPLPPPATGPPDVGMSADEDTEDSETDML